MLRNTLLASVLALGAIVPAFAQSGPLLVGGGDNAQVFYNDGPMGTVVGGGQVAVTGGGDDRAYRFGRVTAVEGRSARIVGGGDNAEVQYGAPARDGVVATREAPGFRG